MYKYFPHTPEDIAAMLKATGHYDLDDLFDDIPRDVRFKGEYKVPSAASELEVTQYLSTLAKLNQELIIFRGAGAYDVYTPSVIKSLTSRQEFLTSYTPYQPEVAQGTLQYIFEYQSMICELTGMDVSNASMYDGATAAAEAVFMGKAASKIARVILSDALNPAVAEVVRTYAYYNGIEVIVLKSKDGRIDHKHLDELLASGPAHLLVSYPNFFGIVEDFTLASDKIHAQKGLMIVYANPSLLSILKAPKDYGADIVCGDGQSLGVPLSFGGPYIGFLTTTEPLMRKMPGRICGMTHDIDGKRGFVLTLQAREQHIRREKANSNICSNQSLMALHVAIYLATMGKHGLLEVANRSVAGAHYLYDRLLESKLFRKVYASPFANEFVLQSDYDYEKLNQHLLKRGFLGGLVIPLPEGGHGVLFAVTEKRTKTEIDRFVREMEVFLDEVL